MTIADLFHAASVAGVRLVNVAGHLQLRGPQGAITPEMLAVAREHKAVILAVLAAPSVRELAEEDAAFVRHVVERDQGLPPGSLATWSASGGCAGCEQCQPLRMN